MIQTSSITAMAATGLICTLYPIVLLVLWRKKTHAPVAPFFVGAGTFFLFALVLVIRDVRRVYRFAKVKIPEKVDETMEKRKEKRLEKAFEKKAGGDS